MLKQLSFRRGREVGSLRSPRRGMRRQTQQPCVRVRAALFALLGKDLTQINGIGHIPRAEVDRRVRRRPLRLAERKALHLLALLEQQGFRLQGALVAHAPLGEQPDRGAPEARRGDDRTN